MATLARDTLLGDRYRLSRRIAVGGMGEVWQAEDGVLHRTVAVKVLKSELTSDPASTFLERFRAEARTTAALSHPGIANVFDYGEATLDGFGGPETAYLVMEFVDGKPLSAILARAGRLPVSRTLDILSQTAAALDVAHRVGMVHRDVKPGNLLVRPDGVVKITDFGIARAADAVPLTQSGMVVGTAQYFSPEQAEGRVVTAASDVYSLGVVAYECLSGRLPFVADSAVAVAMMQIREVPPPLPPEIPAPVRALVARTMAKDPRARFATGGELAAAVHAVAQGRYDYDERAAPGGAGPSPGGPRRPVPASPPTAGHHPLSPVPTPLGPGSLGGPGGTPLPGPALHAPIAGSVPPRPVPPGPVPSRPVPAGPVPPRPVPPATVPPGLPLAGPAPGTPTAAVPPQTLRLPPAGSARPGSTGVGPGGALPAGQFADGPPTRAAAPSLLRTPRWALLVAAIVVLALIVAGGVTALLSRPSHGTGTGSIEPSSTVPPRGPIVLHKSDYVGGDANEVADRLRSLQLVPVIRVAAAHRAGRPGEVIDLVWRGELREGSEIIVVALPNRGRSKNSKDDRDS